MWISKNLYKVGYFKKMQVTFFESDNYYRILVNNYNPIIGLKKNHEKKLSKTPDIFLKNNIELNETENWVKIKLELNISSHILGLGEKATNIDKKRKVLVSLNTDLIGYARNSDPLYLSIPFFINVNHGKSLGLFINYPGYISFDFGVSEYNKTTILVKSNSFEFYIFKSDDIKKIVNSYISLTGKTFVPPKWSIGHGISRYSYYPSEIALNIIKDYKNIMPVDSIYLDIHYMDGYRLFTWDKERYGDGSEFIKRAHDQDIKIVTIIDPSIKLDQNYDVFKQGIGNYIENDDSSIYNETMWPGDSVFPDFFNKKAREYWKKLIKSWSLQGIDGIWLDMNEPTVLTESHLIPENALHKLDDGTKIKHGNVRNLYPYMQCMATYNALTEINKEPFILSRSGYAGIQKYAAIWTGDNTPSWDDLKLQISMVSSLSISGIAVVGCDLGGFFGDSSPELLSAYYKMALLFPFYRNHKNIDNGDQEVFLMPDNVKNDIIETVNLRYDFIDYIYSAIYKAHKDGIPVITPLPYDYPGDENTYYVKDQYIMDNIMYAPQINENNDFRYVYLPEGEWINFWDNSLIRGKTRIKTEEKYPLYIKNNSCIVYKNKILIYGTGKFEFYLNNEEVSIEFNDKKINVNKKMDNYEIEIKKI